MKEMYIYLIDTNIWHDDPDFTEAYLSYDNAKARLKELYDYFYKKYEGKEDFYGGINDEDSFAVHAGLFSAEVWIEKVKVFDVQ